MYVSARFVPILDMTGTVKSTDEQVVCTDSEGGEWWIPIPHEECRVGDWLRFVAEGGAVTSYKEEPA